MNVKSTSRNRRSMENDLWRLKDLTEEVTREMKIGFSSIISTDKKPIVTVEPFLVKRILNLILTILNSVRCHYVPPEQSNLNPEHF